MMRRRGFSLLLVLSLCTLLSVCMAFISMSAQWAYNSALSEERRLRDRLALSAVVSEGRHWLENKISTGWMSQNESKPAPDKFSGVRSHQIKSDGAVLDIYDLNYATDNVPNEGWLHSQGTERFFPPGKNMFLLRAFKPQSSEADAGAGIMLEAVFQIVSSDAAGHTWRLENRPILWREVWP